MSDQTSATDVESPASDAGSQEPAAVDQLDDIEDLDELEFLLEEIESKIAPLALTDLV
jgi:hypothetical protein